MPKTTRKRKAVCILVDVADHREIQRILTMTGISFSQWVRETMRALIGERSESSQRAKTK